MRASNARSTCTKFRRRSEIWFSLTGVDSRLARFSVSRSDLSRCADNFAQEAARAPIARAGSGCKNPLERATHIRLIITKSAARASHTSEFLIGSPQGHMTRVLFAWELGANLGHAARAAAVTQHLRTAGCDTLVAARDVEAAHSLLTPMAIDFVAAPRYRGTSTPARASVNYSDLLGECGYVDPAALSALLRAWINLLRAIAPDAVVVDHAPTALLAAKVLAIPRVLIGTGFSVPPGADPMPPLRAGVSHAELASADAKVLGCINATLQAVAQPPLRKVADLFADAPALITSFRELDPYRERAHGTFVGPVSPPRQLPLVRWPGLRAKRVLAYVNADFPQLEEMLATLLESDAEVVCVSPGLATQVMHQFSHDRLVICDFPVDIDALLPRATLVVSHGGAGLTTQSLMAGVPLLLIPRFVEQEMSATRIAELGAARVVGAQRSAIHLKSALANVLAEASFSSAARSLAKKFTDFDQQRAGDTIVETVLRVAQRPSIAASA
jgi:UDP:flavonoid glycosyltransferase YjiC (YdhE family)